LRLKSIEFDSEFSETVLNFLIRNYSKELSKRWNSGNNTVAVFVHEEYVMRTGSEQTITIVFEPSGIGKCRITVIGSGGGKGIMGIDWGSESAAENTLIRRIEEITSSKY
jgi:hypothetical protein